MREWLLWHCPDWFLNRFWYPVWAKKESIHEYARRKWGNS